MPPLPRKQARKEHHEASFSKRKRTRSTTEPDMSMELDEPNDHAESNDGILDYPTAQMRESILFDTSLLAAEFHPHTSRIILATTSVHEVAVVYLPPFDTALSERTSTLANGNVPAGSSGRRRICWLRDQTQEEARAEQQQQPPNELQPMEQDLPEAQAKDATAMANENPGVAAIEVENQLMEAPGSSKLASWVFHSSAESSLTLNAPRNFFTFATFHPSGEWIYAGTSQGNLLIFDARTRWVRSFEHIHVSV